MGEFGHIVRNAAGFHIDAWGAGPFVIEAGGKSFRFEDSDRFGPSLISKRGDILSAQPSERSPFWKAHLAWLRQGRRLESDGVTCIYTPLRPARAVRIGHRTVVIEHGDPDGGTVIEPSESPDHA